MFVRNFGFRRKQEMFWFFLIADFGTFLPPTFIGD